MSWIDKAKIGDKVRYLGGDPAGKGILTKGEEYVVCDIDEEGDLIIYVNLESMWYVGDGVYNTDCFELVESDSPKTTEDLIANLAKTVTQLERELNALKIKYEIDREMFIKDIAMIDERTKPDDTEANIVRKTVTYEYAD